MTYHGNLAGLSGSDDMSHGNLAAGLSGSGDFAVYVYV